MRIRTIKPEFWANEQMASLPYETRLLAIGLLNYADDEGYFVNNPALIRAAIFPFMEDSRNIPGMLTELSNAEWIRLGTDAGGKEVGKITTFTIHQKISHPQPSRIVGFTEHSRNVHVTFPDRSSLNGMEWNGMEQGKELKKRLLTESKRNGGCQEMSKDEQKIVGDWNVMASEHSLAKILLPLSKARRTHLKQRLADGMMEHWETIKANIRDHSFLRGNNNTGWKITFDALVSQADMWRKIAEGNYAHSANAVSAANNDGGGGFRL